MGYEANMKAVFCLNGTFPPWEKKSAISCMTSGYSSGIAWNWFPLSSTYKYICVYLHFMLLGFCLVYT